MVFWSPQESPFFAFFVCGVPRPPTGCRYLSDCFGWQTKNHAVAVFTLYRTSTHLKNGFFHCHGKDLDSFFTVNARDVFRTVRVVYARALMFFFFLSRVNLQPTWVLIPLREWQKSIAFLVTTAKTEDAKLTFKIISSHHNRPPNSRSSRLFPANSRTAPSPRYALFKRF